MIESESAIASEPVTKPDRQMLSMTESVEFIGSNGFAGIDRKSQRESCVVLPPFPNVKIQSLRLW